MFLSRAAVRLALALVALIPILAHAASALEPPSDLVFEAESRRIAMIARAAPSVVTVFDTQQEGGGSGVLIDSDGYGLTNYHVVAGMLDTRRGLGGLSDGNTYELEVLGIDPTGDVAMFRLLGRERFPHVPLGDSDAVRVGDTAIVMGNPFTISEDHSPSVTLGIVTGTHRYQWGVKGNLIYSDCLCVDAPVNPGNSGGPLFNDSGEVVGITGRISLKPREPLNPRGRFNVGFGYAITSNQIRRFIPALRAGLLARHGTLQARVEYRGEDRIVFAEMVTNAAAHRAEARLGDRLLAFDGTTIVSPNHLASLIGTYPADWDLPLTIERDGRRIEAIARLDAIDPRLRAPFTADPEANVRQVRRVLQAHRDAVLMHPSGERPRRCRWTVIREYEATDHRLKTGATRKTGATGESGAARESDATSEVAPPREPRSYRASYERGATLGMKPVDDSDAAGDFPSTPHAATLILAATDILQQRLLMPSDELDLTELAHVGGNEIVRSARMVEVINWPLADKATADFWFDTCTYDVVRIELRDIPSSAEVSIDLFDYRDVGGVRRACTMEVRCKGYTYIDRLTDWEVTW